MASWSYAWGLAFIVTVLTLPAALVRMRSLWSQEDLHTSAKRPGDVLALALGALGLVCLVELSLALS